MGFVLNGLRALLAAATAGGIGGFVGSLAQKTYSVLGTWGIFAIEVMIIISIATTIFAYFSSIPNMLTNFSGIAAVSYVMDVIGLVKPDNFASCISLVISVNLFKNGLKIYILLWTKFLRTGYSAVSGK